MIVFSNKILTHLALAINASATSIQVPVTDYSQIFEAGNGSVYVYLVLRGPVYREIVKVDLQSSLYGSYLTVARGQGSTIARAWPQGTRIILMTQADFFNAILQGGGFRSIDYNPNEVLTPNHTGEKVYQSAPAGCERWWKAYNGVDPYWDLITGSPCASEVYEDIGFSYPLLISGAADNWEPFYSQKYWSGGGPGVAFTGGKWVDGGFGAAITLVWSAGISEWSHGLITGNVGSCQPTKVRVTYDNPSDTTRLVIEASVDDDADEVQDRLITICDDSAYYSGKEVTLDYSGLSGGDYLRIRQFVLYEAGTGRNNISKIEWVMPSQYWHEWFGPDYWTLSLGSGTWDATNERYVNASGNIYISAWGQFSLDIAQLYAAQYVKLSSVQATAYSRQRMWLNYDTDGDGGSDSSDQSYDDTGLVREIARQILHPTYPESQWHSIAQFWTSGIDYLTNIMFWY